MPATAAPLPPWEPTIEETAALDRAWFDRDEPEPDDYDEAA